MQLFHVGRATPSPLGCALAGCLLLAGCGAGSPTAAGDLAWPQAPAATATVRLIPVSGLGQVLADGAGHALYMFPPDAGGRVSCTGACAGSWPPLAVKAGARPKAATGVNGHLLGTLDDPNTGGRVVTYGGYPLYRYAGDIHGGTANGQALFLNGGPWYVLDPDGQPVTADPTGAS
jgi:predicted lipoprotein with Yx(FWY)xxD motif